MIIGPIATFASDLLGAAFTSLFNLNATISGFLYGALIQVCVMFGVHWGFVAISVNNLATLGYDPITIAGLASAFGQAGVVLMIMLRTKNKEQKTEKCLWTSYYFCNGWYYRTIHLRCNITV